jgi:hypothetical protein
VAESSSLAGGMPEIQRRNRSPLESIWPPHAGEIVFQVFCNESLKSGLIVAELYCKV